MKRHLRSIYFTVILVSFLSFQTSYGTQDLHELEKQTKPSGLQLSPGPNEALEAVLGTGNNLLLKLHLDLKALKKPLSKETIEIPVRLFLTDFLSSPTSHPSVDFRVSIDCESTPPICTLLPKPQSFGDFNHFKEWINQGYFTNEDKITYDFHIDPHVSAPSLTQHLFTVMPGGYRFIGTHVIHNSKIHPDDCLATVSYLSQRGNINITTINLGGSLYLDKKAYPVGEHQEKMPHRLLKETVFQENGRRLYSSQWLAVEATIKSTYEEDGQLNLWPDSPVETYSVVQQKPVKQEKIIHLACLDGSSGKKIDIGDGKIFFPLTPSLNGDPPSYGASPRFKELIASDEEGHQYIMQYVYYHAYGLVNPSEFIAKLEASIKTAENNLKNCEKEKASFERTHGRFNDRRPYDKMWIVPDGTWGTKEIYRDPDQHNWLIKQRDEIEGNIKKARNQLESVLKEFLDPEGKSSNNRKTAPSLG
jgi:hypothetical protein